MPRTAVLLTTTALLASTAMSLAAAEGPYFERVATLPVYATLPAGTDPKTQTSAEIITTTPDGNLLVFTDSPGKRIGFVDIVDPAAPTPGGSLAMGGEPTSATVVGGTVLVGVNTSESKAAPTGRVAVVDLAGRAVAATCDVKGIFRRGAASPAYPTLVSDDDPATGAPIGWGALSGLAVDPAAPGRLSAVSDSYYGTSRIYMIDTTTTPARITAFVDLVKDGKPAAYDAEGIASRSGGGFWVASEGNPESKNPLTRSNLLLAVAPDGTFEQEVELPAALAEQAGRFGFEGVATWGDGDAQKVIVAVQRGWKGDPENTAKLAVYDPAAKSWGFVRYPLEAPSSPAGGWVGLSEIVPLGGDRFALIERDNQPGADATFKSVTIVSLEGVAPKPYGEDLPTVSKTVAMDLLPAMRATGGWISDKPEGLAVVGEGEIVVVTDNDGVDGASGETMLLRLGKLPATN